MAYRFLVILWIIFFLFSTLAAQTTENSANSAKNEKVIEINQESSSNPALTSDVEIKPEESNPEEDAQYNIKLRTLEEKINSLKDKIFRAKQRLSILQETVLSGAITGARLTIVHNNSVGGAFQLISAIYYLDEAPIFKKIDEPQSLTEKEIVVFDGSVIPGPHHLSAYLVYKGKGYGVFSYLEGYTFKIKAGYSFNMEEGKIVELFSEPKDRGAASKLENRLFVEFGLKEKNYEAPENNEQKDNSKK